MIILFKNTDVVQCDGIRFNDGEIESLHSDELIGGGFSVSGSYKPDTILSILDDTTYGERDNK